MFILLILSNLLSDSYNIAYILLILSNLLSDSYNIA
jgi:hypothetical protein